MTHIGDYAFCACIDLIHVNIPESVRHIGKGIFLGCNNLTQVNIPEGVTHISDCAFLACNITQVNIPISATHIGSYAFESCKGLTKVIIPNQVVHIDYWAFYECTNLNEIIIPESITFIGGGAFHDCDKLRAIIVDTLKPQEFERIRGLVPEASRHLVTPYELWFHHIPEAKKEALAEIEPLIHFSRLTNFDLMTMIYQMDENLYQVIDQVPIPRQMADLAAYQQTLKNALKAYFQASAKQHQRLAAIDKLTKYTQVTEQAISEASQEIQIFLNHLKMK